MFRNLLTKKALSTLFSLFFIISIYSANELKASSSLINSAANREDNFHEVEKGLCYRSNQLTPEKLASYIKEYGIKTVINLRKESTSKNLKSEKDVCKKAGISFIHIPLDGKKLPDKKSVEAMLKALESASKPLLIHCLLGRDRTGLFCALYALKCQNKNLSEALDQLSFEKFGHDENRFPQMKKFIRIWHEASKNGSKKNEAIERYSAMRQKS
jgi:uncharacterized protein (TIGR01244 family)